MGFCLVEDQTMLRARIEHVFIMYNLYASGPARPNAKMADLIKADREESKTKIFYEGATEEIIELMERIYRTSPSVYLTPCQRVRRLETIHNLTDLRDEVPSELRIRYFACSESNIPTGNPLTSNRATLGRGNKEDHFVGSTIFPLDVLDHSIVCVIILSCGDVDVLSLKCASKGVYSVVSKTESCERYWKARVEVLIDRPTFVVSNNWRAVYNDIVSGVSMSDLNLNNPVLCNILTETDIISWPYVPNTRQLEDLLCRCLQYDWKYRGASLFNLIPTSYVKAMYESVAMYGVEPTRIALGRVGHLLPTSITVTDCKRVEGTYDIDALKAVFAEAGITVQVIFSRPITMW